MPVSNEQINTSPLVSVVMCTYNGEKFLRPQLDSILAQTYSNIELVIADDASTDNTVFILEEYRQQDPRLRYVVNTKNKGYNKNFEFAFSLAAAEYIAISDQDDIWDTTKIEKIMKTWPDNSLFVFSLSGSFSHDFASRTDAPKIYYAPVDNIHKLVFNSPVHGHACMFKKELLKTCLPFPEDIFYDWWMSMHAASIGTIGCIPLTLTWHRMHGSNISRVLTSIKDKENRNGQLRQYSIHAIESFCRKDIAREEEKKSLMQYVSILRTMDGKKISWPMFRYIMKHRKLVFHYKRKPLVFISHVKRSLKMARKGVF